MRLAFLLLVSVTSWAQWIPVESHTSESLRGVSVANQRRVWASGTHGTYLISENAGQAWTVGHVPGADSLDFRGVKAFADSAFLLAAGPGGASRIYYSAHLGEHWKLQFTNPEPEGFFDCMAFFDKRHGLVVGDPVNGKFRILRTDDGGAHWNFADPQGMPPAMPGEGAFAASNSCLTTQGRNHAWFVTGGTTARVFRSSDGGNTWQVTESPILHGAASAGIFSVSFSDGLHGVIGGGDYAHPESEGANLAMTEDGGKSWELVKVKPQKYFSAVTFMLPSGFLLAVGSSASALSKDWLRWEFLSTSGFNAIALSPDSQTAFAVGANGSAAKMILSAPK